MQISDSTLDTKDAFWHSKNVTVRDSVIKSEYLGWYSENLTLVNCRIVGAIDGVKNPLGGKIEADSIKEIIMEETIADPSKTQIICPKTPV